MNYKTWTKYCKKDKQQNRKRRSDAYSNEEKTNVESFYERHSTPLSQKQTIDKNEKQKMILTTTTSKLFKEYSSPNDKMSLSTFRKIRPKKRYDCGQTQV